MSLFKSVRNRLLCVNITILELYGCPLVSGSDSFQGFFQCMVVNANELQTAQNYTSDVIRMKIEKNTSVNCPYEFSVNMDMLNNVDNLYMNVKLCSGFDLNSFVVVLECNIPLGDLLFEKDSHPKSLFPCEQKASIMEIAFEVHVENIKSFKEFNTRYELLKKSNGDNAGHGILPVVPYHSVNSKSQFVLPQHSPAASPNNSRHSSLVSRTALLIPSSNGKRASFENLLVSGLTVSPENQKVSSDSKSKKASPENNATPPSNGLQKLNSEEKSFFSNSSIWNLFSPGSSSEAPNGNPDNKRSSMSPKDTENVPKGILKMPTPSHVSKKSHARNVSLVAFQDLKSPNENCKSPQETSSIPENKTIDEIKSPPKAENRKDVLAMETTPRNSENKKAAFRRNMEDSRPSISISKTPIHLLEIPPTAERTSRTSCLIM